jgi:hypothetical protein
MDSVTEKWNSEIVRILKDSRQLDGLSVKEDSKYAHLAFKALTEKFLKLKEFLWSYREDDVAEGYLRVLDDTHARIAERFLAKFENVSLSEIDRYVLTDFPDKAIFSESSPPRELPTGNPLSPSPLDTGKIFRHLMGRSPSLAQSTRLPNTLIVHEFIASIYEKSLHSGVGIRSVFRHLGSHLRRYDLSEDRAAYIFRDWKPEELMPRYVENINKRRRHFEAHLEAGFPCIEIYDRHHLERYILRAVTESELPPGDPIEEVEERLEALLDYQRFENYLPFFLDWGPWRNHPSFIVAEGECIFLDLRPNRAKKRFDDSSNCYASRHKGDIARFWRFFNLIPRMASRKQQFEFIEEKLERLKKASRHRISSNR